MVRCPACGRRTLRAHAPCGAVPPPRPEEPTPAPPAPVVAGYEVERLLGRGGFASVWAARTQGGGRCALKVALDAPAARAQLAREAEALRGVGPPAAPALLDSGVAADGRPWLALELVEGPSLADALAEAGGDWPRHRLAEVALPFLDALAAAHARGWAHGDVKPENVILQVAPPAVRLLDLGLAAPLVAGAKSAAGEGAGTPEYQAPEQCRGAAPDARSDVYAAGALLFELATGRPPFLGAAADVRHAHQNLRPPSADAFPGVSPALAEVLRRCLAKSPAARPATAGALREAVAAALGAGSVARVGAEPEEARLEPGARGVPDAPPPVQKPRAVTRRVALVYLASPLGPVEVQAAAAALGAAVAHAERDRYALVLDAGSGQNPVRAAVAAAQALVARGACARARVDLDLVTARARPGGGERWLSRAFSDPATWPGADAPAGVLVTARAADALPQAALRAVPGRDDLLAGGPERPAEEEATVLRQASGPLLGREALLDRLLAAARDAAAAVPTLATVVGEAGHGKTHLAAVLAERLRSAGDCEVLELRAAPAHHGGALGALLRQLLDLGPEAGAPRDGGAALLGLALPAEPGPDAWPAVALALGWLLPDAPGVRALGVAPGALVSLAVRAASGLLAQRAARRPVALLVDDAHLVDAAALDALELAALAERRAPLLGVALARPDLRAQRPWFGERAGRCLDEELPPLEPAPARELCRELLRPADAVAAEVLDRLVGRARGVPLLMVELVRGLRREGLVRRHPHGAAYVATEVLERVPDMPLVEWVAEAQLRALPPELAAHARLAALLGDEAGREETEGVLDELARAGAAAEFPLDAEAAVRRLLAAGVLAAHRGGRTGFRLPVVRDAVARAAPEDQRRAIHEAALRFYGRPGHLPELARLERLARHAIALGQRRDAADACVRLGDDRAARHAWLDAEAFYGRALEQLGRLDGQLDARPAAAAPGTRLAALRGRGLMRSRLGRQHEAVADLAEAGRAADALGELDGRAGALLDEATALDWMGDYGAAAARVEAAAAAVAAPGPALRARLLLGEGRALFREGRWSEAARALEEAVARAGEREEEAYESLVVGLLLLGGALPPLGRSADADAALERARALTSARRDLVHLCVVHCNRRNLSVARGDLAGALADQAETRRLARELGRVDLEYYAEFNLGELHYQAGDLAAAAPHVDRAAALEAAHPEVAPVPHALLLRARMRAFAGEPVAPALAAFHASLRRAASAGVPGAELPPGVAVLADAVALAARGTDDAAWDAVVERSARASVEEEPIEVLELRGLSALRAGRREAGRAALELARAEAERRPGLLARRVRRALEALGPG